MSWSLEASSLKREDLGETLNNNFERNYPEANDGVQDEYRVARHCVDLILDQLDVEADDLVNSVSLSGHSALGESDQNTVSVYVSAHPSSRSENSE